MALRGINHARAAATRIDVPLPTTPGFREAPAVPTPSFEVGDKAVHPAHGVGEVTGIERREIAGNTKAFYVLRILDSGMKVMVPTASVDNVGLRVVMSVADAERVLEVFTGREKAVAGGPWNRRQRAYNEMIKSGSPTEVARVLRDLYSIKLHNEKDLSYGERRLMDQAKALLVKELGLALRKTEAQVEGDIERIVGGALAAS